MNASNAARPIRRPASLPQTDARGVRVPTGADSSLFGGWGIRF